MRRRLAAIGLSAAIALAPGALVAAPALRGIMHGWRSHARSIDAMLAGRQRFDEAAIRRDLENYAAEAGQVAAAVHAHSAQADDFRHRFATFQSSSQAALADLPHRRALKADFRHLISQCQSCHNSFNN
jgi:cytochrome c556